MDPVQIVGLTVGAVLLLLGGGAYLGWTLRSGAVMALEVRAAAAERERDQAVRTMEGEREAHRTLADSIRRTRLVAGHLSRGDPAAAHRVLLDDPPSSPDAAGGPPG